MRAPVANWEAGMSQMVENLAAVRERIAAACARAKRNVDSVQLMTVTKSFPASTILEAYNAGQRLFGESRMQEFEEKSERLKSLTQAEWHLIGHLQTNKAQKSAALFHAVDTVDSLRLAEKLNFHAAGLGKVVRVLIEINIGREESKAGLFPDSAELNELLVAAERLRNLEFRGLMTVPPFSEDPEKARPYFRSLRQLRDQVAARHLPRVSMDELSMGMSNDFEVAIAEGSSCVRLGTAIFGQRNARAAVPTTVVSGSAH